MANGSTIVVTGGTAGIGAAIVRRLVADGHTAIAIARGASPWELPQDVRASPLFRFIECDLRRDDAITRVGHDLGDSIFGIVNNAGIWCEDWLHVPSEDEMDLQWRLNVRAPYLLVRRLQDRLEPGGRIVNIASQLALTGRAGMSAYSASKHALLGLTRCWALELGPRAIAVNAVCPGWIDTSSNARDFERTAALQSRTSKEIRQDIESSRPIKRLIAPNDVACLVAFLLGPAARDITGEYFAIR
jgi:NAD(P)-dependent dehydrogenase (short-subunit alcohol dehydrogenase family)